MTKRADDRGWPWRPWRLRMADEAALGEEAPSEANPALQTTPDASTIGYSPTPPAKHVPAKVVSVSLTFDSGATIVYPCDKPIALRHPPRLIDLIGGKAFIDERQ